MAYAALLARVSAEGAVDGRGAHSERGFEPQARGHGYGRIPVPRVHSRN